MASRVTAPGAHRTALLEMGERVDQTGVVMLPKSGDPASLCLTPLDAVSTLGAGFLGALALWRALQQPFAG